MSTLTIATIPPIVLSAAQLLDEGRLSLAGGGASPTLDLALDPGRGEIAALLDPPPLRAQATLTRADGTTFAGLVQAVRLGPAPSLTLES
jgi:hypothetical protein